MNHWLSLVLGTLQLIFLKFVRNYLGIIILHTSIVFVCHEQLDFRAIIKYLLFNFWNFERRARGISPSVSRSAKNLSSKTTKYLSVCTEIILYSKVSGESALMTSWCFCWAECNSSTQEGQIWILEGGDLWGTRSLLRTSGSESVNRYRIQC